MNYKRLKGQLNQLLKEDVKRKNSEQSKSVTLEGYTEDTFLAELEKQLLISSNFFQQKKLESNELFQTLMKNLTRFTRDGSLQVRTYQRSPTFHWG
jgi:hypothetical protein